MDRERISEKLIKLRGSRTQAEVAKEIGVSTSAYTMYETGQRVPRDEIKTKIAKLYNRTVQFIFFS